MNRLAGEHENNDNICIHTSAKSAIIHLLAIWIIKTGALYLRSKENLRLAGWCSLEGFTTNTWTRHLAGMCTCLHLLQLVLVSTGWYFVLHFNYGSFVPREVWCSFMSMRFYKVSMSVEELGTAEVESDEEMVEELPTRVVTSEVVVNVRATVNTFSFDGLTDQHSILTLLTKVAPRHLIVAFGSPQVRLHVCPRLTLR